MSDEHVWTYEYENHGNGAFWEWWNILRDGDKIGTVTTSEDDAKMICTLLNAAEGLSAEDARNCLGKLRGTVQKTSAEALRAYADIREGKIA